VGALSVSVHSQEAASSPEPEPSGEAAATDETQLTFEDEEGAEAPGGNLGTFGTWDYVRMVIVLAAVIGAIYLVFWLLKRGSRGRMQNSRIVRVLGSHGLPGNKGLHVVEVGNQIFLVGTGDETVRLISEITDQESIDEMRLIASEQQSARPKSFGEALTGFFSPGNGGGPTLQGSGSNGGALDFLQKQRERVKNLQ
jgi:flagellar protein FliO/FliZ